MTENLVNVDTLAKAIDYNPHHLRALARTGVIPATKTRKQWLFNVEACAKALGIPYGSQAQAATTGEVKRNGTSSPIEGL